jgi:hypothetical protein
MESSPTLTSKKNALKRKPSNQEDEKEVLDDESAIELDEKLYQKSLKRRIVLEMAERQELNQLREKIEQQSLNNRFFRVHTREKENDDQRLQQQLEYEFITCNLWKPPQKWRSASSFNVTAEEDSIPLSPTSKQLALSPTSKQTPFSPTSQSNGEPIVRGLVPNEKFLQQQQHQKANPTHLPIPEFREVNEESYLKEMGKSSSSSISSRNKKFWEEYESGLLKGVDEIEEVENEDDYFNSRRTRITTGFRPIRSPSSLDSYETSNKK